MKTKRNLILKTVVPLFLVVTIVVSSVVFTAGANQNNDDDSMTYYSYGGQVVVQLPDGLPAHPTTFRISSFHVEKRGDYPVNGPNDVFVIYLWIPALNGFMPVAAFSDHPDEVHHNLLKEAYFGTPLWIPGLMENYFVLADEELITTKRGDVFFANLTQGVHVSLPFDLLVGSPLSALGDMSFDLPPMAIEIRGIDARYYVESGLGTLPSGWSNSLEGWRKPAWVQVWIPAWVGASSLQFAGIMGVRIATTVYPPST